MIRSLTDAAHPVPTFLVGDATFRYEDTPACAARPAGRHGDGRSQEAFERANPAGISPMAVLFARLYGRRAAKNRAAKAPPLRNPRVDYRPQDRVRSKRGAAKLFCSCENE